MSRYQNGKIYTIRNQVDDEVYVGSTCMPLHKRFYEHKNMKKFKKTGMKLYKHVDFLDGWDNFYIELHEDYPCENKNELLRREGQVQRELKASLNKNIAGRTQKEYYEENKETIAGKRKKYNEANKDKIKEKSKIYYEANMETIAGKKKKYREANKDKIREKSKIYCDANGEKKRKYMKQYAKENRDIINLKHKQYRDANKELIKEKKKIRIQCECGAYSTSSHMTRHKKSKKHIEYMESTYN